MRHLKPAGAGTGYFLGRVRRPREWQPSVSFDMQHRFHA
jgi:hypothetical protein